MPFKATSIYNRAGTVHIWALAPFARRATCVRSLCGLVEELSNTDRTTSGPHCKRCLAADKKAVLK